MKAAGFVAVALGLSGNVFLMVLAVIVVLPATAYAWNLNVRVSRIESELARRREEGERS